VFGLEIDRKKENCGRCAWQFVLPWPFNEPNPAGHCTEIVLQINKILEKGVDCLIVKPLVNTGFASEPREILRSERQLRPDCHAWCRIVWVHLFAG
jgi:hypothetical protein